MALSLMKKLCKRSYTLMQHSTEALTDEKYIVLYCKKEPYVASHTHNTGKINFL